MLRIKKIFKCTLITIMVIGVAGCSSGRKFTEKLSPAFDSKSDLKPDSKYSDPSIDLKFVDCSSVADTLQTFISDVQEKKDYCAALFKYEETKAFIAANQNSAESNCDEFAALQSSFNSVDIGVKLLAQMSDVVSKVDPLQYRSKMMAAEIFEPLFKCSGVDENISKAYFAEIFPKIVVQYSLSNACADSFCTVEAKMRSIVKSTLEIDTPSLPDGTVGNYDVTLGSKCVVSKSCTDSLTGLTRPVVVVPSIDANIVEPQQLDILKKPIVTEQALPVSDVEVPKVIAEPAAVAPMQ
ncbi:MAG: hypothetical protein V1647_03270 [Pseudomonadota bacterium]